jgi:hypothetical protein
MISLFDFSLTFACGARWRPGGIVGDFRLGMQNPAVGRHGGRFLLNE